MHPTPYARERAGLYAMARGRPGTVRAHARTMPACTLHLTPQSACTLYPTPQSACTLYPTPQSACTLYPTPQPERGSQEELLIRGVGFVCILSFGRRQRRTHRTRSRSQLTAEPDQQTTMQEAHHTRGDVRRRAPHAGASAHATPLLTLRCRSGGCGRASALTACICPPRQHWKGWRVRWLLWSLDLERSWGSSSFDSVKSLVGVVFADELAKRLDCGLLWMCAGGPQPAPPVPHF